MTSQQQKEVLLAFWMEVIGVYDGHHVNNDFVSVRIGDKLLSFPRQSIEAEIIQNQLKHELIGRKIALLRTDNPATPLLIRIIENEVSWQ